MNADFQKAVELYQRFNDTLVEHAITEGGSPFKGNLGNIGVESLRLRHFAEGKLHDQRVTTERTPYAGIIVKSGQDKSVDVLVGDFESTWEYLKKNKDPGIEFHIEVQVTLSEVKRNRTVGVVLFSPQVSKPDMTVNGVAQHLENMSDRRKRDRSVAIGEWKFFFEEPPERFDGRWISEGSRDRNITIDGVVRLLDEICSLGVVQGDPFIRVGLFSSCGIIIRGSGLKDEAARTMLKAWLYDMVDFTNAEGRTRLWDSKEKMFRPAGPPRLHPEKERQAIVKALAEVSK